MNIIKLETLEQLEALNKDDIVIVEWKEGSAEHRIGRPVTSNYIYGLVGKPGEREVILNKRFNSYFIINMYLNGTSHAKVAYVVTI